MIKLQGEVRKIKLEKTRKGGMVQKFYVEPEDAEEMYCINNFINENNLEVKGIDKGQQVICDVVIPGNPMYIARKIQKIK